MNYCTTSACLIFDWGIFALLELSLLQTGEFLYTIPIFCITSIYIVVSQLFIFPFKKVIH